MMVGTIAVLDAYYPGGLFTLFATGTDAERGRRGACRARIAFTTLMMFQLFDVYNCRSRRRSAFAGFFENKWLLVAMPFSLATHFAVIYVPVLQAAFHTVPLTAQDWLITVAIGASLLIVVELAKMVLRARREPPRAATVDVPTRQLSAREST